MYTFFQNVEREVEKRRKICQKLAKIQKIGEKEVKLKWKLQCCEKPLILGLRAAIENQENTAENDLELKCWRLMRVSLRT